ncbi:cupin domain-containing protein [Microbaculum marinum]|uniref:Cupin domain-containing protein n=1 Tax=Microbaculum marinum TaxID=1764581 RepID=A0AAW9RQK0_9HYPH
MALHHARPGEIVDVAPMGAAIAGARTSAIIKTDQFEAIRLIVRAGLEIPEHEVPGNITLHCLEGRVQLGLESTVLELGPNQWVYLAGGAPHSLKGIEDSSLLLTIFFPQPATRSRRTGTE